jgi:hypothetical protein
MTRRENRIIHILSKVTDVTFQRDLGKAQPENNPRARLTDRVDAESGTTVAYRSPRALPLGWLSDVATTSPVRGSEPVTEKLDRRIDRIGKP